METHKLFDENEPKCLYFDSNCDVSGWGSGVQWGNKYTCQKCAEIFEISYFAVGDLTQPVDGFVFSCNDLKISHNYTLKSFAIIKMDPSSASIEWIPEFDINFADKNALYKKIKTYLIFS